MAPEERGSAAWEDDIVHCYAGLAGLVARMAELASAREWRELPALEAECTALVERLRALPPVDSLKDPTRREQIHKLLQCIRFDQDSVVRAVRPQLCELLARIGTLSTSRNLDRAYGLGH